MDNHTRYNYATKRIAFCKTFQYLRIICIYNCRQVFLGNRFNSNYKIAWWGGGVRGLLDNNPHTFVFGFVKIVCIYIYDVCVKKTCVQVDIYRIVYR